MYKDECMNHRTTPEGNPQPSTPTLTAPGEASSNTLTPAAQGSTPEAQGEALLDRYQNALLNAFGTPQRVLSHGKGARVWDVDGKEYLDLLGGIAVNTLGHAHPALVEAVTEQIQRLAHVSNFYATPAQIQLAENLLRIANAPEGSGVFFANSGTEANEAALKLARLTGKPRIIALEDSFHGRTLGALSLTWKAAYREPFAPLPGGVTFLPVGDVEALEKELASGDVGAVIAEPIQGEAGIKPLPAPYLRALRELTRAHGALLILDEVQCGLGRTGIWFAHQVIDGLQPDVMTLAKGLGGGLPIGAVIAFGPEVRALLHPGQHGTTFGGNPLAAAAALAVIETVEKDNLLAHATAMGQMVAEGIAALNDPRITEVRGRGLLLGIGLRDEVAVSVVPAAASRGFLVNAPNPTTIRLAPPMIVSEAELMSFLDVLPALLTDAARGNDAEGDN